MKKNIYHVVISKTEVNKTAVKSDAQTLIINNKQYTTGPWLLYLQVVVAKITLHLCGFLQCQNEKLK